jgi:hypothetical protein
MSVGIAELLLLGLMAATGITVTAGVLVACLAVSKTRKRRAPATGWGSFQVIRPPGSPAIPPRPQILTCWPFRTVVPCAWIFSRTESEHATVSDR